MTEQPPTALHAVRKAIADALRPDPQVRVDEWAEANRILPPDTPEPGPYRNARTPYLIDIQRAMSPGSPIREAWLQGPHQLGKSVTGENLIGAWICTAAGSILVVFPTLDDAKQWELARFEPMRANTRALRRLIKSADTKGSDNTKLRKKFRGGVMRLVGANRVGALKSSTIRYVKFEEPDEYVTDLGEQGHPIDLAIKRTSNFGRKAKIYGDGTPTIEGRSAINKNFRRGDQRRWHLHCPDCRHPQPLQWSQIKWIDGNPDSARYTCTECGSMNPEAAWKTGNYAGRAAGMTEQDAAAAGLAHWQPTAQGEPGVASWHLNALAAPLGWRPWPALVIEWLGAQGDEEKLKSFVNNHLGECWADTVRSDIGADQLQARAEGYDMMSCPPGGLVCTAGVDTQNNRLAVVIRAFGRGEESWGVWHAEIPGDPAHPETWDKLRALLESPIRHHSGQVMRIDAVAIDAGGHRGEHVYAFCRDAQLRGKHWFAIRGAKSYDAPKLGRPKKIEFTWRGQPVPGGAELRHVGTQAIKNLVDARLRITQRGGGCYHFPLGFDVEYFKQLRSEKREWRRDVQGHKALWWVKATARNEAWDCEVYAYAAFLYAMAGQHAETVWRNRERLYGTAAQVDLFDGAPAAPAAPVPAPPPINETPRSAPPAPAPEPEEPDMTPTPAPAPLPVPSPRLVKPARGRPLPRPRRNSFALNW